MKRNLGDTSNIERISIVSSVDGLPVTGLDNTSSGLIISTIASNEATPTVYTVAAANVETIATLGTYAAPTASKCRFKEIDATNHPGDYEIQLADARYAVASSTELLITASGVADMLKTDLRIQLNVDKVDTTLIEGLDATDQIAASSGDATAANQAIIAAAIAALNDLAQSDILSDATPFAGASVALILADTNLLVTNVALLVNYVRGRKILSKSGLVWSLTVFDHTDDVTPILVKAIKDYLGNDIDDLVAGQLARELKSSV